MYQTEPQTVQVEMHDSKQTIANAMAHPIQPSSRRWEVAHNNNLWHVPLGTFATTIPQCPLN